jgi:hypothetical protein
MNDELNNFAFPFIVHRSDFIVPCVAECRRDYIPLPT